MTLLNLCFQNNDSLSQNMSCYSVFSDPTNSYPTTDMAFCKFSLKVWLFVTFIGSSQLNERHLDLQTVGPCGETWTTVLQIRMGVLVEHLKGHYPPDQKKYSVLWLQFISMSKQAHNSSWSKAFADLRSEKTHQCCNEVCMRAKKRLDATNGCNAQMSQRMLAAQPPKRHL